MNSGDHPDEHPGKAKYLSNMKSSDIRAGQLRMICDSEDGDELYLVLRKKGMSVALISYEWEIFHRGEVKVWLEYEMNSDIIVSGPGAN